MTMLLHTNGIFILLCLAAIGFAVRGIALLVTRQAKPGRVISPTGVVAMISVWVFAGMAPFVCAALVETCREFNLPLPPVTKLVVAFFALPYRYFILWYPAALGFGLCALTMPEIFFRQPHPD
jgi:hypothetical protein